MSFVLHTLTCLLHVDGIQAIKIYIAAIYCVLLVAAAVRLDLPPTQTVGNTQLKISQDREGM